MKLLQVEDGGEFIFNKLRFVCKKQGITIRYITSYVYKENEFIERDERIIVIMKDLILIDSGLSDNFWVETMETANYLWNKLPTKNKSHNKIIPKES